MIAGRTKSLEQIKKQYNRMVMMEQCNANRGILIQRIFTRYYNNILHYMHILIDTPETAGDFRWLDSALREKRKEVNTEQIDRLIYSYAD